MPRDLTPEFHEEAAAELLGANITARSQSVSALAQAHAVLAISLRMRDAIYSGDDLNDLLAATRPPSIDLDPPAGSRPPMPRVE